MGCPFVRGHRIPTLPIFVPSRHSPALFQLVSPEVTVGIIEASATYSSPVAVINWPAVITALVNLPQASRSQHLVGQLGRAEPDATGVLPAPNPPLSQMITGTKYPRNRTTLALTAKTTDPSPQPRPPTGREPACHIGPWRSPRADKAKDPRCWARVDFLVDRLGRVARSHPRPVWRHMSLMGLSWNRG